MKIEIPEGVNVSVDGNKIVVKGDKGEVERTFKNVSLKLSDAGKSIEFAIVKKRGLNAKALEETIKSHINNMLFGVKSGYSRKLKIIYAHFPFTMEKKDDTIVIKNFLGERVPRYARIFGPVDVKISKSEVVLSSPDKDALGQTYGSLKRAIKIRNKDPRIFQDGLYEE